MLAVLEVARHVFWNDCMYDRKLLPSEASLERCKYTLADLDTMSGQERITVFKQCDIDPCMFPLFLRSLQHITALHNSGSIDDNYLIHRHLSAHDWSPSTFNPALLGYPTSNSQPYRDRCTDYENRNARTHASQAVTSAPAVHYNGLLNQGATCYLNSLLQALFHISAFRSIIYQMPTKEEAVELATSDGSTKKSIPYALQRLFCMLQTGSTAIGTTELTQSFGWGSADSFIQHDVHELTRVLLDNLEEKLNAQKPAEEKTKKENAINRLFNGSLESYIKVEEVGYYGAREEPFYDLQLVVKNTKNIYASFDTFFQVEVLDGKNKYCLETDGKKTYYRAEKGVRLKKTPPIMLLHLARFDYDLERGETKVFTRWDYYNTLDLSRYMPEAPPEETHYTLCSVLVHAGSNTGFGHYFCFLMCSGAWYKFNDETVTPASLKEVFGANFGGFKINYWGSEVPHTANAYMLVYIRTSLLDTLLRPIDTNDVPKHVMEQFKREAAEQERVQKEKAEDYLYGRVHFVQPQDIVEHKELLTSRRLYNQKYSNHRMLRVRLEAEALPAFHSFVERQLDVKSAEQLLWFASPRQGSSRARLHELVKPGVKVESILNGDGECCVLVTCPRTAPLICMSEADDDEYELYHHKLYDPLQLQVIVLGCSVVRRTPESDPAALKTHSTRAVLKKIEPFIRNMIGELPDTLHQYHGHHLRFLHHRVTPGTPCATDSTKFSTDGTPSLMMNGDDGSSHTAIKRGIPKGDLFVVREGEHHNFLPCNSLSSGDILVWQQDTASEDPQNLFYPDVESFQRFLRHRIPVEIKLNQGPTYPTLIATELADDMQYEQLQRYVARLIGDLDNYDRIRFTRYNPETELPYFMKGKKKDRPTLAKLLTPATNRITTLSRYLYYEYCKFTVTEIENAHSLQFKLYSDHVKPISSHWVLMPREVPITAKELFSACIREIQQFYASNAGSSGKVACGDAAQAASVDFNHIEYTDPFVEFLMGVPVHEAWKYLRLVDVWRGRIYNILDKDHPLVFEHQTFEESAEYRIERIPQPIPGTLPERQVLVQVHHFTMIRQRKESVETHSEPFSFYVNCDEMAGHLLNRIARKLEMSYAAVMDWKVCLVRENRVVEVLPDVPMGVQLSRFCEPECYRPNQKEPSRVAFIGLEHAPTAKRLTKREEKVVILN